MTNQGRFWSWVTNGIVTCLHKWLIQLWAEIIGSAYAAKWLKVMTFVLIILISRCFRKIANIFTQQKSNDKMQTVKQLFGGSQRPTTPVRLKWIGLCRLCFLYVNSHIVYWPCKDLFPLRLHVSRILAVFAMVTQPYFSNLTFTALL